MRVTSFDTETHPIKPGCLTPRMVCLSYADRDITGLLNRPDGIAWAFRALTDPDVLLVGANIAYDLAVLCAEDDAFRPLVFAAYAQGRVRCVEIRQRLIDVAQGEATFRKCRGRYVNAGVSLANLVDHWLDEHLEKEDTWRLRYHELDGIPIADWPQDAQDYPLKDAVKGLEVYNAQEAHIRSPHAIWSKLKVEPLADEAHQNRAAWAMQLMMVWGVRTDPEAVDALQSSLQAQYESAAQHLKDRGIMRAKGANAGSVDTKLVMARVENAFKALRLDIPRTATGRVSIAAEHLETTGDPDLLVLAQLKEVEKVRSQWLGQGGTKSPVNWLRMGTEVPINARYSVVLETGRTSCSKPNMQNPPKDGGVRLCFVPRDGMVYVGCDYDTLEMRTLAQSLEWLLGKGKSAMADALRRGEDLHTNFAADWLKIPRAEAAQRLVEGDVEVETRRQHCKPGNFGFPGGMSAETFVAYARGYGVDLTLAQAQQLHGQFRRSWPEMEAYFRRAKVVIGPAGEGTVVQLKSKRVRGKVGYCQTCNTYFQGLAADGAKEAMWRVQSECYNDEASDLYGCRLAMFLHDELILECPTDRAAKAAERLAVVMREAMQEWVPDIPIKCAPVMMKRWYKGAKGVRVGGVLVPCKPSMGTNGKKQWVHDA